MEKYKNHLFSDLDRLGLEARNETILHNQFARLENRGNYRNRHINRISPVYKPEIDNLCENLKNRKLGALVLQ